MITRYILLASLLALSACTYSTPQGIPDKTSSGSVDTSGSGIVDTGSTGVQPPLGNTSSGTSDEYTFFFDEDTMTGEVTMLHTTGKQTKVYFINDKPHTMDISVDTPSSSTGNIRLSQIIMPDGTMDGPFGSDTSYELDQLGGYTLIFSENQMAGDPWSGDITVKVALSDL